MRGTKTDQQKPGVYPGKMVPGSRGDDRNQNGDGGRDGNRVEVNDDFLEVKQMTSRGQGSPSTEMEMNRR